MSLAILVPVLRRPQNVTPLLDSIAATTPRPYRVLFLCDPGDVSQQDAIARDGGWMLSPGGSYAHKINIGVRATDEPLILLGADDIRPRGGWFEAATVAMTGGVEVVGLNDLIPRPARPSHATHFLMTREAAMLSCAGGEPGPLCEQYLHFRSDDELIATATQRGIYTYAPDAVVEHLHPMCGTAPDDDTYRKGRASARIDGRRFAERMHLWT